MKNKIQTRSKDALFNALINLMTQKSIKEITILELTKDANVARRTFYSNFKSKDAIIQYGTKLIITNFLDTLNEMEDCDLMSYNLKFFSYFQEYAPLIKITEKAGVTFDDIQYNEILYKYTDQLSKFFNLSESEEIAEYQISILSEIFKTTLQKWNTSDFTESVDEISSFVSTVSDIFN